LLNQLGMEVTSLDVSPSVLALGQRLVREHPVIGRQPRHAFGRYDGIRMALPDQSFDRILCFDAFHHVANPERTLKEFAQVLDDGGIASFSEPGPRHSMSIESQRETRDHKIIENDITIEELWEAAQAAGFTNIRFSLQTETALQLGYEDHRTFRAQGFGDVAAAALKERFLAHNGNVTVFHLVRGEPSRPDSRARDGLVADLRAEQLGKLPDTHGRQKIRLCVTIRNVSGRVWRRLGWQAGCVNLGVRRLDERGQLVDLDYFRHRFLDANLSPGGSVAITFDLPMPSGTDRPQFELDLVSEGVSWFSQRGARMERLLP
jgi:SAM-dependent methyltransferase